MPRQTQAQGRPTQANRPAAARQGFSFIECSLEPQRTRSKFLGVALAGGAGWRAELASRVKGLSEAQFWEAYGTEERCQAVVRSCGGRKARLPRACGGWKGQVTSYPAKVRAGLPPARSHSRRHDLSRHQAALTTWFLAMWLIATANGVELRSSWAAG